VRVVSPSVPRKVTTVRIDDRTRDEIRTRPEAQGVKDAEFIRQAIVFYLGYLHGQASPGSSSLSSDRR
jgi:hypothetical protein